MEGRRRRRSSLFGSINNEQQSLNYRSWLLNEIEELMEQQKRLEKVVSNKQLQPTEQCDLASILKKKGVNFTDVDNYASIAMSFLNKHVIFMENEKFMMEEIKQLTAEFIKQQQKCIN